MYYFFVKYFFSIFTLVFTHQSIYLFIILYINAYRLNRNHLNIVGKSSAREACISFCGVYNHAICLINELRTSFKSMIFIYYNAILYTREIFKE